MVCKKCGQKMRLDDVDFNFKGNKDNYFACDNCGCSCLEKIRYSKQARVMWDESGCKGND